ncbi:MAG: PAS domain S-box protein [Gallionella sp.]|nr:PAS domain S-box protein [Gallionella sp.]
MSDPTEKLRQELQAARRAVAELQARLESREAGYRLTALELEENRSALLFMLEDLEAGRKRIELAHREWMAALDVVDDPIFLHDKEYRVLRCNKAYQRCAGIPFEQIIGQPYYTIFPKTGEPLPCCLRAMEKVEEEEEEVAVGDAIYRSRSFSVHDEQGAHLYSVHILEDITDSRRAKIALIESEKKFRMLFDAISDTVAIHDMDGRFLQVNRSACEHFGYSQEELLQKNVADIDTSEFAQKVADRIKVLQEQGHLVAETAHMHRDGSVIPVELSARIIDYGGQPAVLSVARDIAERKRAEQELRLRAQLLDSTNDSVFVHDLDGNFIYLNEAAWKSRGYTRDELIGMNLHVLDVPEHEKLIEARSRELMEKGQCTFESAHRRKDGSVMPIEVSARLIESGGRKLVISAARDITERKRVEQALRDSEATYRSLFENTLNGIAHCRMIFQDGVPADIEYITVNKGFKNVTGLEGVEGRKISEVIPGYCRDNPESLEIFGKVARTGEPARWEHYLAALGRWFSFSIYSPAQDEIVIVSDNITERKEAEIALKHANRALATLSEVNRNLVYATDENDLLQAICRAIVEQCGYRLAWVGYKQHDENKSIKVLASAGHDEGYLDAMQLTWAETGRGMGSGGRAMRSGVTQLCQDMANDPLCLPWCDGSRQHGYASCIVLPLLDGDNAVFGILTVYAAEANTFIAAEVALLEEMAEDLAFGVRTLHTRRERDLALEQNRRQLEQLQSNLEDTVRAIATIVEMRDPYTAGHQARVADLAAAIAGQMGLPDDRVHSIRLAGVVHDLGKVQIPAEILSKPGRLSVIEYSLIQTHAQAGYDILKGINFPWPIAQMVLQHHERIDGSGYPQGLKGDAILLEARILSVADVVESMFSHRPYRPGMGMEVALEEIAKNSGTLYDPQVVDACLALFREQGYRFA